LRTQLQRGSRFRVVHGHVRCLRERAHDPEIFPDLETPATRPPDYVEPDPDLLRAWDEFAEVLGQLHEAELDKPEQVRTLAKAVMEAAARNGVEIEPLPRDGDV
jgi:hypothetical protein